MSLFAGRAYVGIAVITLLGSAVWLWVMAAQPGPPRGATAVPAVVGLLAAVALLVGVPLLGRFGEVSIEGDAMTIRSVLCPRRVIALAEIEDVVVVESLLLPARAAASVRRLVIRTHAGRVIAVTPKGERLLPQLHALPVSVIVDPEPLTPAQAARRYPGAVSPSERLLDVMVWSAVVIPVIVVVWLLVSR